jgi:hypothetical protein
MMLEWLNRCRLNCQPITKDSSTTTTPAANNNNNKGRMMHRKNDNVRGLYFVAASHVFHRQPPVLSQKQLFKKDTTIPVVVDTDFI